LLGAVLKCDVRRGQLDRRRIAGREVRVGSFQCAGRDLRGFAAPNQAVVDLQSHRVHLHVGVLRPGLGFGLLFHRGETVGVRHGDVGVVLGADELRQRHGRAVGTQRYLRASTIPVQLTRRNRTRARSACCTAHGVAAIGAGCRCGAQTGIR
jgi:hypothetical protein